MVASSQALPHESRRAIVSHGPHFPTSCEIVRCLRSFSYEHAFLVGILNYKLCESAKYIFFSSLKGTTQHAIILLGVVSKWPWVFFFILFPDISQAPQHIVLCFLGTWLSRHCLAGLEWEDHSRRSPTTNSMTQGHFFFLSA